MSRNIMLSDLREAELCRKGARAFCDRHNLSWMVFIKEGFPPEVLLNTGDAMAANLVERVNGRIV